MKSLSSFTHPHVVPNLYDFLSSGEWESYSEFGYQHSSEYLAKFGICINFADKTLAGNRNNKRLLESFQYFLNIKEYMQKYKDTTFIGGAQNLEGGNTKM